MKTIEATLAPPADAPRMQVNVATVAELYGAALAFEIDAGALNGLGDMARVNVVTTAGAVRRLLAALEATRASG